MRSRISILLFSFVLLCGCQYIERFRPKSSEPQLPDISGTWELLSYKGEDPAGRFYYPFEKEVLGQAIFETSGVYSIQIYNADRDVLSSSDPFFNSDPEIRLAFLTSRASYGHYLIEADSLVLQPTASTFPNLQHKTEKRVFLLRGDSLLLLSKPVPLNGILLAEHTVWRRISD